MSDQNAGLWIGIDVGGTNTAAVLAERSGSVLARAKRRTPAQGTAAETLEQIFGAVDDLLQEGGAHGDDLNGIGLAIAGVVNEHEGRVVATPNMNLGGLQVVEPVEERFDTPVALGNDVDLGTLGEVWLGAARGARSVVGMFIGTGIGGGVVMGGRLVRGVRLAAGEIGHMVMELDGPQCGCGGSGCFEAIASRTAIERDIRAALGEGRKSALTDILDKQLSGRIKSGSLKKALKAQDPLVTEVVHNAARVWGLACLSVRHLLDPEVIVLGGGVIEACREFLMPIVVDIVASDPLPGAREGGRVVPSMLGDDAVMLGAIALAQQHLGLRPSSDLYEDEPEYPQVEGTKFGSVTIGGEEYERDVIIRADGKVKKRKKKIAKQLYGTSHRIGPRELARTCKGNPDLLVIGTGQSDTAELTEDGEEFLRHRGIDWVALPSPDAVDAFNAAGGRKALLLHVTC